MIPPMSEPPKNRARWSRTKASDPGREGEPRERDRTRSPRRSGR